MAKMKHMTLSQIMEAGKPVTVGNNRVVRYDAKDKIFIGSLHGHEIIQYSAYESKLCLDDCGYRTTTTRAAMNDFIEFFSLSARVSFVKGLFNVFYLTLKGNKEVSTDESIVTVSFI